ncbi:hypothetical protein A8G00_23600 [Sphingobium sp. SA916]|nr:hypothetical protein A8G00_23600 [Sphingobium sp. SA916]
MAAADEAQVKSAGVGEIIVTAQRRGENLQSVPIAVTAMSQDALEARGVRDTRSLEGLVPNLTIPRLGSINRPFLRGVGSDSSSNYDEPSVATYIDGYYIAAKSANQLGFNNLVRIEVLKGPQGTLFGRNATGGVIQLVTKDPTQDFHGDFGVGYGNYQTFTSDSYISSGIAPGLAADLAVQYSDQGKGFGRNLVVGNDINKYRSLSIRNKWVYTGDTTKVSLFVDYEKSRSNGLGYQLAPESRVLYGYPSIDRFDVEMNQTPYQNIRNLLTGLRIEKDLGFARLTSSTFYANYYQHYFTDIVKPPQTPNNSIQLGADTLEKLRQYTQEFQLQGNNTSGIRWQSGVYLFRYVEDSTLVLSGVTVGPDTFVTDTAKTSSIAIYGQMTYEIGPKLNLTGGLRYTYDKNETTNGLTRIPSLAVEIPGPDRETSSRNLTWRLALDYQMAPDVLAYASYNRGAKSGGFSVTSLTAPSYNPEQLDAYEVGLKTQLFDRAVRFNIAGFYYDYQDLQVLAVSSNGTSAQIFNAGKARVYGLDADFEVVPFENLTLAGGFGYLDGKYTSFPGSPSRGPNGKLAFVNVSGNRMTNAPEFSGSVSLTYAIPTRIGDFKVNGTLIHKGLSFATPDNRVNYPSYSVLNASIGWTSSDGRLGIDVWGRNLTDKAYYGQKSANAFGYFQAAAAPRTYGVRVKSKF